MLSAHFDVPTHAERPAIIEQSQDTPERLAAEGPPAEVRFSIAAQAPPADLARAPADATGECGAAPRPGSRRGPTPQAGDSLDRLQHARLTLLRRAGRGEALSEEEGARYAYATARLERMFPRVTVADFERLADAADEITELDRELSEIRGEFNAAHPSNPGRSRK